MDALTMSIVSPKGSGVEVEVVRRIVAVDIRIFDYVGSRTKHSKVAECVANYIEAFATEGIG